MIRPGRQPRPDSACHSADILTPTERAAEHQKWLENHPNRIETVRNPASRKTWGDHPEIRAILESLRSTSS